MKLIIPEHLSQYQKDIEKTFKPVLRITTHVKDDLLLTESKLGGIPYWPDNLPLLKVNECPPKLMAQINFSDLSEKGIVLPHYPRSGILQFFVAVHDDMWGLEFNSHGGLSETKQNGIAVVYHSDLSIPALVEHELIENSLDNSSMPFSYSCQLNFQVDEDYLGFSDAYYLTQYTNIDLYGAMNDDLKDDFYDILSNAGSKIGGYAYFTQQDPRGYIPQFTAKDEWLLLLQIDTDKNVMWGDCGVANWFIKKEDLINLDFSHVFFNWDCC